MPLSSSYHDYGGGGVGDGGSGNARRATVYRRPAAAMKANLAPAATLATRSSVHPVTRGSLGLRQPSLESTSTAATTVTLGTASLRRHKAVAPASPRDTSTLAHLPQPVVLRGGTTTPPATSPRQQQQQQQQQQRAPGATFSSRSSATSSRRPRRTTQPLAAHTNPSRDNITSAAAGGGAAADAGAGTPITTPRVSGLRSTSYTASVAALATTPRTSAARGDTAAAAAAAPLSLAGPSRTPRTAHLRPLSTSREADYVNLAYQRSFMGRFRCAAPVVVRTAASATPHTVDTRKGEDCQNHGEAAPVDPHGSEEGGEGVPTDHAGNSAAEKDAAVVSVTAPEASAASVDQAGQDSLTDAAGEAQPQPQPQQPPPPPGSSMLCRPRLRVAGSSASVASGSTARGGRGRRLSASYLQGTNAAQPAPSVTASSLPRRSMRTIATTAGTRKTKTNAKSVMNTTTAATTAVTNTSISGGAAAAMAAANMTALAHSGLHSSLWVATQEGAVEVRSLANPATVLAALPRRDPRSIITALVAVCGNRVVAGSTDGRLHVFDAVSMREAEDSAAQESTAPPHTAAVTRLLYVASAPAPSTTATGSAPGEASSAPTAALLLAASLDRTITVWAAASMTLLHRLKGNVRGVCAMAATSTGGYAFSGSDEGTLRMWDVVRGTQWGVTMEERAQLGRRSREAISDTGGDAAGELVARPSHHRVKEYTESSDASTIDEDEEEETDGDGSSVGSGADRIDSRRAIASPRPNNGVAAGPPPSHRRPPLATRPGNSSGGGAAAAAGDAAPASNRRSLLSYGGVKAIPRASAAPAGWVGPTLQEADGALASRRRGAGSAAATGAAVAHASSRSLPTTDETFAPTDTTTSFSPLRDGDSVLAGPGGGISPLRTDLTFDEAAAEDEGHHTGDGEYGYAVPRPTRRHRGAKGKTKRLARDGSVSRGSSTRGAAAGATKKRKRVRRKKARRSPSPAHAEGAAATPTATATALEQRLSAWMRLYQQRVLFSTVSHELTTHMSAGYDRVGAMNWPVEAAHMELVTALAVVEDRLLVSASCDATAKVFALPSGQYMRTLTSSRRMPLAGVVYDAAVRRLYTGFSDGAVAVYDAARAELPLLMQLQSVQTVVACTFAPLALTPMQRFVFTARSEDGAAATSVVARFDRTTQAHGPHQTVSTYRVGQPSLRELLAAVSLQTLQQQRAAAQAAMARRHVKGSVEQRQLREGRQCGLVLAQSFRHRTAGLFFMRWQRWLQRRAVLRRLRHVADAQASFAAQSLLGRYMRRWLDGLRQRSRTAAAAVLRRVQLQGSDVTLLTVGAEARRARWSTLRATVSAMAAARAARLVRIAYHCWRIFQLRRRSEVRQPVCYNTLLLSMDASAYAPGSRTLACLTDTATRRARLAKALWLLTELTSRRQTQALRRRYFDDWRSGAAERQRAAAVVSGENSWSIVEPLSSTLVQQRVVRLRYFALWHSFALHVARSGQLRSERETLQGEWRTLQRALAAPTTVDELKAQMEQATSAAAAAARESEALAERVRTLADEDSALRTEEALRVLIAGYYVPDAAAPGGGGGAFPSASPSAGHHQHLAHGGPGGSASSERSARQTPASCSLETESTGAASRGRGRPSLSPAAVAAAEDAHTQSEEEQRDCKLLREAGAVLRALKGNCMQSARDDKLLARAHALALRLPVLEPLSAAVATSAEVSPNHRAAAGAQGHQHPLQQQQQQQQRPTTTTTTTMTWSVSSARNGASAAVSSHTSPSSSQRRRRHSTLSGGSMSSLISAGNISNLAIPAAQAAAAAAAGGGGAASSGNAATTPRTTAAQMWAAQPAEENYPSLADAFNAIYAHLLSLLYSAAKECGAAAHVTSRGAATSNSTNTGTSNSARRAGGGGGGIMTPRDGHRLEDGADAEDIPTQGELHAPAVAPSWLVQVPLKQRRVMVGEVLKLVTLFDSFAAHSDLPVERAGSFSTRGAANTRALPLCSLCSTATAQSLLRHAAVLLELVDPQLWPRQLKLNYLQDAYAAAIAELNATVSSSSHVSDARQHSSTIMTRSESEGCDASPLPTPLMMRPPSLCLSPEVLQHAADALKHGTRTTTTTTIATTNPAAAGTTAATAASAPAGLEVWRSTRKTATPPTTATTTGSTVCPPTLLLSNPGSFVAGRSDGTEEEGQTSTPDPLHAQSTSFSHRTHSAVSTPRSYTPRTATSSVANTSAVLHKPYLGFRVNVTRDAHAGRRASTTISIRDVAAQYVNAEGVEVEGPALVAGLLPGDQLVRFAGYAVTDLAAFNAVVSRHVHSGAELPVVVQRDAELLSTMIVVGTRIA